MFTKELLQCFFLIVIIFIILNTYIMYCNNNTKIPYVNKEDTTINDLIKSIYDKQRKNLSIN